jgi:hypothetical protein
LLVQKKSPRKHLNNSLFWERRLGAGAQQAWGLGSVSSHWHSCDVFGSLIRNITCYHRHPSLFVIPAFAGMTAREVAA